VFFSEKGTIKQANT